MKLEDIGWNCAGYSHAPNQDHGRIALATRDHFIVWTQSGEVDATMSGHLRYTSEQHPCVGDWVALRAGNVISELLPRRTQLVRKQPGREMRQQVLAANLDVLLLVTGLDHDYNPKRLERYLILAYESGARPIVVLTKADLRTDLESIVSQTQERAPGISVVAVSALTNFGIDLLTELLQPAQTAALIGSSGAGKSTLVNCLLGSQRQITFDVRAADSKGRHTTTRRELIRTPQGWLLMDLPGLRELQLWADPETLDQAFSEITDLAQYCRFRDCTHLHEPGCAVRESGLPEDRLASYNKIQRELGYLAKQNDRQAAAAFKSMTKAMEKQIRRHPKRFRPC